MRKKNRIFVLGFFLLLVGASAASNPAASILDGSWGNLWHEYVSLITGLLVSYIGIKKIRKVT